MAEIFALFHQFFYSASCLFLYLSEFEKETNDKKKKEKKRFCLHNEGCSLNKKELKTTANGPKSII